MKIAFRLMLPVLLAVTSLRAQSDFESVAVEMTERPRMPVNLRVNGVKDCRVIMVLDIDPEGKVLEWLVLGASHRELIEPCVEAALRWRYKPARIDGRATLAQLRLTIDLDQRTTVVGRTTAEMMADFGEKLAGREFDYQVCPASEIDRLPVPVTTVAPRYSPEARKEGVSGRVKVNFYIDELGNVRMPAVPADAHPYLASM
ncbi:MAG: energy transducer TonB, partial [Oleiharenicola lentus]